MRVGVIGGGAAGLVASIFAKDNNNEVVILEKNSEVGKKILSTGNGRCNYWNDDQDLSHYESSNVELIGSVINCATAREVLSFFDSLGIVPKIKNGYYYPFSNQASTIRNVLLNKALNVGVRIINNVRVIDISKKENEFVIMTDNIDYYFDKVILATGSKACPITGSDGMGYNFLKDFGHTIVKPLPSLVQLESLGDYLNDWNGIRTDARVSLYVDGEFVKSDEGEIQLTGYGISGICVFNISNYVSLALNSKKKVEVRINFLPFIESDTNNWLIQKTNETDKSVLELLQSILNSKLANVIIKRSYINKNVKYTELDSDSQVRLCDNLCDFSVEIVKTKSFNEAQVCRGGVLLSEINLLTMESKLVAGLYIVGELLDLTGECGGYNLGVAWRSGIIAGKSIGDNND